MPYEKKFEAYPYKALICDCKKPTIKSYNCHLIGNLVPRLLPGTSFICKCGGYIDRQIIIPKETRDKIDEFWAHSEVW